MCDDVVVYARQASNKNKNICYPCAFFLGASLGLGLGLGFDLGLGFVLVDLSLGLVLGGFSLHVPRL